MITLWPHQAIGIADIQNAFRQRHKRVLYTASPGAGKTNMAAYMVSQAEAKRLDALFICNRLELLEQTARAFGDFNIGFGIIGGGYTFDPSARISIASIDALKRNLRIRRTPRLVIWDECRGLGAAGWTKVFNAFPDAYHVGLDATPIRTDGKSLGEYFTAMVCGPSYSELRRLGRLVPFKSFAPAIPDMTGIRTVRGEFDSKPTEALMDRPMLVGDIVANFKERAGAKQGLVFGCSRIHSEHLAAEFRSARISAAHLDGDTDKAARVNVVNAFRTRKLQVLTNCQLFTAGFDVPGIEIIVDASPTQSVSVAVQRWGRGSRAEPGKPHCELYDHAGNCLRHGLPDADREWSLDGGARRKSGTGEAGAAVRQCPAPCLAVYPASADHCPECGTIPASNPREIEEVAGDLVEIQAANEIAEFRRKTDLSRRIAMARTLEDFEDIARAQGYARGWSWHRWQARQRRRA